MFIKKPYQAGFLLPVSHLSKILLFSLILTSIHFQTAYSKKVTLNEIKPYLKLFPQFKQDKTMRIVQLPLYEGKIIEIRVSNAGLQILRFQLSRVELIRQYCQTVFIFYELDPDGFLIKESRYKSDGKLIDQPCESIPVAQYQIIDKNQLIESFKILNDWDGNKKILGNAAIASYYDSNLKLISQETIGYNEYWKLCNYLYGF